MRVAKTREEEETACGLIDMLLTVGRTCEGELSSLVESSHTTGQPVGPNITTSTSNSSPTPHSLMSFSATGQKLLQVKHESSGGGAKKKLGVCWRENSRGHELPAVVFRAQLLPLE